MLKLTSKDVFAIYAKGEFKQLLKLSDVTKIKGLCEKYGGKISIELAKLPLSTIKRETEINDEKK